LEQLNGKKNKVVEVDVDREVVFGIGRRSWQLTMEEEEEVVGKMNNELQLQVEGHCIDVEFA
jgi:hypothetical protein